MEDTYVGAARKVKATFTNASGAFTDPTTVKFAVLTPSGSETIYTFGVDAAVERLSVGVFELSIDVNEAGEWWVKTKSTNPQTALEEMFTAKASRFRGL